MKPPYGTLNTPNIESNLSIHYIPEGPNTIFLGAWELGQAVGATDVSEVPSFVMPADESPDPALRADIIRANSLLSLRPRKILDAFTGARLLIINAHRQARDLRESGHDHIATADRMGARISAAFDLLRTDAAMLDDIERQAQKAYEQAAATFPGGNESEVQAVMYDAAIVAKVTPLQPDDITTLKEGMLPARFGGARTVQALMRTPRAVTGLTDEQFALMRDAHVLTSAPATHRAVEYLRDAIEQARGALASAVLTLGQIALMTPAEAFERIGNAPWIERRLARNGVTRGQLTAMADTARQAAARKRPTEAVQGREWRAPIG